MFARNRLLGNHKAEDHIFTARKRSLRRLCFYICLSVILSTGSGSASVHAGIADPLGAHPPRSTPPQSRHFPCTEHAGRYGQQAGGMHPTGMHTCLK